MTTKKEIAAGRKLPVSEGGTLPEPTEPTTGKEEPEGSGEGGGSEEPGGEGSSESSED